MNRFKVAILLATLFACGCARVTNRRNQNSKMVGQMQSSPLMPAHVFDPFEERGKVQISNRDFEAAEDSAGTSLAVTLRAPCENPGWLVRSVLTSTYAPHSPEIFSYLWKVPQGVRLEDIEAEAMIDACVIGVTNSTVYSVNSLPNDPQAADQGHLAAIEADSAFDVEFSIPFVNLKPVVLAIIDTGFDLVHEDLRTLWWTNPREIPNNGIDDDRNGYIDDVNGYDIADNLPSPQTWGWLGSEHGTHVTGLAAAQGNNGFGVTGVMGCGVHVMALNVFGKFPGSLDTDLANAIRYAADNGADVINLSVGGKGANATYEAAIGYAISKGVTIVAAAGNDGKQISNDPAAGFDQAPSMYAPEFSGLITVASTDSSSGIFSYFSNYNPTYIKMSAPGSENSHAFKGLLSTWPGSQYHRSQGTSMASPVVAGAASLAVSMLRARGYNPSPATIERILERSSINNDGLKDKIQDGRMLNLRQLVDFISRNYQPQS